MQHLGPADFVVIGAFAVAFLGLLTWVITYAVSSRGDWRLTREGRHLMTFRASLVLLMAIGTINSVWTSYPGRDVIRCVVMPLFAVSVLDGLRILLLAQREGRIQRLARLQGGAHRVMQLDRTTEVDSS
jgi:hypothetical protein